MVIWQLLFRAHVPNLKWKQMGDRSVRVFECSNIPLDNKSETLMYRLLFAAVKSVSASVSFVFLTIEVDELVATRTVSSDR